MNKLALARFIEKHPHNYICQYFQNLINCSVNDIDMTDFETIHDLVVIAKKNCKLSEEETEQVDILLTNLAMHG